MVINRWFAKLDNGELRYEILSISHVSLQQIYSNLKDDLISILRVLKTKNEVKIVNDILYVTAQY